jgi:hypothetical protein
MPARSNSSSRHDLSVIVSWGKVRSLTESDAITPGKPGWRRQARLDGEDRLSLDGEDRPAVHVRVDSTRDHSARGNDWRYIQRVSPEV